MRVFTNMAALGLLMVAMPSFAHELTLKIGNIQKTDGNLLIAIYDQQTHFDANSQWVAVQKVKVTTGPMRIVFSDLPTGHYAVKLFQDENDNGRIDMNATGIPTEPYGFSANGGIYGPPSFDDSKVKLDKSTEIDIQLR
ncbi:MAG TPA: DUF2141 domain-containing protein [Cellvibrio sp.]|nr:DUF2141 domain-containing protein [Cellvibrio sp.]